MKKKVFILMLCIFICLMSSVNGCAPKPLQDYGVFLGINADQANRLDDYRIVVIEPSEFTEEQIKQLQADGKTVYGYLNIGAIESYRPYYARFQDLALDVYENWPDENWIDVSSPGWQGFIIDELGKQAAEMGLDGFFLDNADVYYHYPSREVFEGLVAILKGLKTYDITLIINGGDTFVSECIDAGIALSLFDGINQETVFTSIDFENKTYGKQTEEEKAYFQAYLAKAKSSGLAVFLLEYRADRELAKEIDTYCKENGFFWYNAESIDLQ
jgi:hypothetical protein